MKSILYSLEEEVDIEVCDRLNSVMIGALSALLRSRVGDRLFGPLYRPLSDQLALQVERKCEGDFDL